MPIISSIETQRRRGRVTIFVDGIPWLSVHPAVVLANGLRRGLEADEALKSRLQLADDGVRAHEAALLLLSYRMRSEAELRERLTAKGFAAEQIESALERLRASGLVDDANFARSWVDERGQGPSAHGRRRLSAELRRKGISSELIEQSLEPATDPEALLGVALARAQRLSGLTYEDFRRRLGGFLARRGYGYAESAQAVREAWRLTQADSPDQHED